MLELIILVKKTNLYNDSVLYYKILIIINYFLN